jgi:putative ABC transport system permease protein
MNIAWRNLARDRARLLITAGGVGSAVLLILIVNGLYTGVLDASTAYVRSVDTDVWVAQEGSPAEFFESLPLLNEQTGRDIEAVAGVVDTVPLLGRAMHLSHDGGDADLFVVGVDADKPWSAPATVAAGTSVPSTGEIVLDGAMADGLGVGIGDTLKLPQVQLTVSGITSGSSATFAHLAWIHAADAARFLQSGGLVNYYLVRADGDPSAVASRIRSEVPGTLPMTTEEFAQDAVRNMENELLPILWVLVLIGLGVGTAVIGLTIYTATIERRREYGVLKAIGFSNRKLVMIVLQQSVAAGVIGLGVGIPVTFALAELLERMEPEFVTTFTSGHVLFVAIAALAMTLVAAVLPIRPVLRLDPADVFRDQT